ncbi:MAG: hypothetical protein LBL15_04975 [Oscillospiraceae bacterium]|jgi:hypothetical protein|nr:hypothetical protein [Oscillospiraceae bacterium]
MLKNEKAAENASKPDNARYIASMHRLGRGGMIGALLIMLGMPTVLGVYFDALPGVGQILQAAIPLLIIFLPSNLFEVLSYTPILGSAIYLTLMTGEVINLKLPVVNVVFRIMAVEAGTVEADVIASVAVSIASLVTMLIVALGIALTLPLQPVLALPSVKIASNNLFPAVMGALLVNMLLTNDLGGGIYARGRLKGLVLPAVLVALLTGFDSQISAFLHLDTLLGQAGNGVIMSVLQGFVIIAILPVAYFSTKRLYNRGAITVDLRKGAPPDE